jgi:hypothetical protein
MLEAVFNVSTLKQTLCGWICRALHLSHAWQLMKEMSVYIEQRNRDVFGPAGLRLINPLDRGLRVLEVLEITGGGINGDGDGDGDDNDNDNGNSASVEDDIIGMLASADNSRSRTIMV